ncbi:hypothetical protein G9A89_000936 [Geosiphon pyriformis]|nr:hypothetical protein G9A89_000936 [Geosiphon pyriformis]
MSNFHPISAETPISDSITALNIKINDEDSESFSSDSSMETMPDKIFISLKDLMSKAKKLESSSQPSKKVLLARDDNKEDQKQQIKGVEQNVTIAPVSRNENETNLKEKKGADPTCTNSFTVSSTNSDEVMSNTSSMSSLNFEPYPISDQEKYVFQEVTRRKRLQIISWIRLLWPIPAFPTNSEISLALTLDSFASKSDVMPFMVATQERHQGQTSIQTITVTRIYPDETGRLVPELSELFYEPREFLLSRCPSFRNLPSSKGDPLAIWEDKFLLNKLLPLLGREALEVQKEPALFLTVKEAIIFRMRDRQIFQCRLCQADERELCCYDDMYAHLRSQVHGLSEIHDDEIYIRVDPQAYVAGFFPQFS